MIAKSFSLCHIQKVLFRRKKGVNKILCLCRNENYNGYLKRSFRNKNSRHDVFVYNKQHTGKHGSPMNFNPSPAISHNHDLINSVCAKRG